MISQPTSRMRLLTTTLLVLALLLPVVPAVRAETSSAIDQAQQELNALRDKAKRAETELAAVAAQANVARAELDLAEQQLAVADSAYQTIADQSVQVAKHLQKVEVDLSQTKVHLAQRKEVVADRLRSLQEQGRVSYLEVLLGATSFNDFNSRLELLGAVLRKDRAVFDGVKKETELLEEQKRQAVARKTELESLQAQALAKQQEIEERKNTREVASRSLSVSQRQWQAELDEIERAADRVLYQVALLQAQQQNPSNGAFSPLLPVPGPALVTSLFGPRYIFGGWSNHGGVDFNARMGSPIMAVESGVVIISGWDNAYGNYIVIDHGGGISTLYGHNSERLVGVGDRVTKGQQIALAGSTGKSTGAHCHLEILVNGARRNFLDYIPQSWYSLATDA